MPVDFSDYDPVIHCAPDAAYALLKKFYKILTGREYYIIYNANHL
jgi:hypothetical protein